MAGEWRELAVASTGAADRGTPVMRNTGNISSLSVSTLNTTTGTLHTVLKARAEPSAADNLSVVGSRFDSSMSSIGSPSPTLLDELWKQFQMSSTLAGLPCLVPTCSCGKDKKRSSTNTQKVDKRVDMHYHRAVSPEHTATVQCSPTPVQDKYMSPSSVTKTLHGDSEGSPAAGLEPATLQEACLMLRPQLLRRSKERQTLLKERARNRFPPINQQPSKLAARESVTGNNPDRPVMADYSNRPHYKQFIPVGNARAMTKRQIYDHSMKYWEKLPEVVEKREAERRRSEAVTNRLRVKLYQQVVLTRLRKRRCKRTVS